MGEFNVGFTQSNMAAFCNEYKLKALNKEPTCFKNNMSLSCIDLLLTNFESFGSTLTIETGLSDFHKLIVKVLKIKPEKVLPKIIQYRDYKNFDSTRFFEKQVRLTNLDMNSLDFESLKKYFMELLHKFAPLKAKFLRANHSKFVTKGISKAIMLRTKLRNQFLKKRTLEARTKYNKQSNICVSLVKKAKQIIMKI